MTLLATKRKLEKFFYTAGTNIALYNAERKEEYRQYRIDLKETFLAQVKHYDEFIVRDLLGEGSSRSYFTAMKPTFIFLFSRWGYNQGGQAALNRLMMNKMAKVDKRFILNNPEIIEQLRDGANFEATTLDNTTNSWVMKQVEIGYREGLTSTEIAEMIQIKAPDMATYRAEAAAHTRLTTVMSKAANEMYLRNGLNMHTWQNSGDDRVSDECLANGDDEARPIGESFSSGATEPPAHISCRCWTEPIIPENFTFDFEEAWLGE